jgi:imidazolonepropionase-like amidohydrolase
LIVCGPLLILALSAGSWVSAHEQTVAFLDVNVIPMDREGVLHRQTVVVVGGRILRVAAATSVRLSKNTVKIDGRNRYLMPGLIDMHVHLIRSAPVANAPPPAVPAPHTIAPLSASTDPEGENRALGLLFVANGVTSVRNMWGDPAVDAFAQQVESGHVLGPHVYSTGPITDGSPYVWEGSRVVQTEAEAQAAVEQDKQAGRIALKVYNGVSAEAYHWLISAARSQGLAVVGHVPDAVGLRGVIAARQDSIEHLDGFLEALQPAASSGESLQKLLDDADTSQLPALVESVREAGVWNCPTLVLLQSFPDDAEWRRRIGLVPPALVERYRAGLPRWHARPELTHRAYDFNIALVRALHQGGARLLLLGTDTPKPTVLAGFSLHEELRSFVEAGLSPYEAIRAGTSDAAIFLHQEKEIGTVTVGQRADLLLLEANPLEDVRNVARRVGVMVAGQWLDEAQLQRRLAALKSSYRSELAP